MCKVYGFTGLGLYDFQVTAIQFQALDRSHSGIMCNCRVRASETSAGISGVRTLWARREPLLYCGDLNLKLMHALFSYSPRYRPQPEIKTDFCMGVS